MRDNLIAAGLCAMLAFSTQAAAQDNRAQRLFEEGKALLARGEVAKACDKFDESNQIDSTLGSLLRAADCREQNGQLAAAWRGFTTVIERASGQRARAYRAEAKRRADALEPRLPRLDLSLKEQPIGATVTLDGEPLAAADWKDAPLDPGPHVLVVSADGYEPYRTDIAAAEGKHVQLLIPALTALSALEPSEPELSAEESEGLPGTQVAALVVGGVGVAATITGAVFGGLALSQWQDVQDRCPASPCSEPNAGTLHEEPLRNANVSTGLLAAGGAMVAAGVVMWLLGAPAEPGDDAQQTQLQWWPILSAGAGDLSAQTTGLNQIGVRELEMGVAVQGSF